MKKIKFIVLSVFLLIISFCLASCEKPVSYEDAKYEWNSDYSQCTATIVCTTDESKTIVETVKARVETVEATCETKGKKTYFVDFENEQLEDKKYEIYTEALGHRYEITYEWQEENTKCVATAICSNDASHKIVETANSKVEVLDATCDAEGSKKFSANFTNSLFDEQLKVEEVNKVPCNYEVNYIWNTDFTTCTAYKTCTKNENHTYSETVNSTSKIVIPTTCDNGGLISYNAKFTDPMFEEQSIESPTDVLQHNYVVNYTWSEDHLMCTASAVCSNDPTHVMIEPVNASTAMYSPTCEEDGKYTYEVIFITPLFESQRYEETIDKLEHDYSIDYHWNFDYTICTATATCRNDGTHIINEQKFATINGNIHTVTFDNDLFEEQIYIKEIEEVDSKVHYSFSYLENDASIAYLYYEDGLLEEETHISYQELVNLTYDYIYENGKLVAMNMIYLDYEDLVNYLFTFEYDENGKAIANSVTSPTLGEFTNYMTCEILFHENGLILDKNIKLMSETLCHTIYDLEGRRTYDLQPGSYPVSLNYNDNKSYVYMDNSQIECNNIYDDYLLLETNYEIDCENAKFTYEYTENIFTKVTVDLIEDSYYEKTIFTFNEFIVENRIDYSFDQATNEIEEIYETKFKLNDKYEIEEVIYNLYDADNVLVSSEINKYKYDEFGREIWYERSCYDKELLVESYLYTKEYDINDNIIKIVGYTYDSNGNLVEYYIEEKGYNENNELLVSSFKRYDKDNNIIGQYYNSNQYDSNENLLYTIVYENYDDHFDAYTYKYEYDENGNQIKELYTKYNEDRNVIETIEKLIYNGEVYSEIVIKYFNNGNLKLKNETIYNDEIRLEHTLYEEYNEENILVYKNVIDLKYHDNGELSYQYRYEFYADSESNSEELYEYNEFGITTKSEYKTLNSNNEVIYYKLEEYSYHDNGLKSFEYCYTANYELNVIDEQSYTYDENGNELTYIFERYNGDLDITENGYIEYKYHDNGNISYYLAQFFTNEIPTAKYEVIYDELGESIYDLREEYDESGNLKSKDIYENKVLIYNYSSWFTESGMFETLEFEYNEFGNFISRINIIYDGNEIWQYSKNLYDDFNNLTYEENYGYIDNIFNKEIRELTYNENNLVVKNLLTKYSSLDTIQSIINFEYQYNEYNYVIYEECLQTDGNNQFLDKFIKEYDYHYNDKYSYIRETKYYNESDISLILTFEYDENGIEIYNHYIEFNELGEITNNDGRRYQYDENGNILYEKSFKLINDEEVVYQELTYTYENSYVYDVLTVCYNDKGNIISKTLSNHNEFNTYTKYTIIYEYDNDDELVSYREYKYDFYGNLLSDIVYDKDNNIDITISYRYDIDYTHFNEVKTVTKYLFDENNNEYKVNSSEYIYDDITIIEVYYNEYDLNGNITLNRKSYYESYFYESTVYEYVDNELVAYTIYYYNEFGNVTKTIVNDILNDEYVENLYEYEYDENGNVILLRKFLSNDGEFRLFEKHEYLYEGNELYSRKDIYYYSDGQFNCYSLYILERVTEECIAVIENGFYMGYTLYTYSYDELNNVSQTITNYDLNGNIIQ